MIPRPGLRITLGGDRRAVAAWTQLLQSPGTQIVQVVSPDAAAAEDPTLAVFFAAPEDAASVAQEVSATGLAFSLVVGDGVDHPHTRLLHDLIEAKRDWQGAFDAMVDPLAVVDLHGTIVRANLALARALGCPVTAVVGADYRSLLGEAEAPLEDPIVRSIASALATTAEGRFAHLPGTRQITVSPLQSEEGHVRGAAVVLKDVSELHEQQARLLQASRLADVGMLAAGVAHEINTPLASIGLRAESLLRSAQDPQLGALESFKNFPRYLTTIGEEILRCKKIIGALLDFGRTRKHEVTETSLSALAQSAADLVSHELRIRGIGLSLELDDRLPLIRADHGQIRQVLLALLRNAMEATPPEGQVSIETRLLPGRRVRLTIRDDGEGIQPENLQRVFSPFFTTRPMGQGTGLGLAICHGIVTGHDGEIRVESQPKQGTSVTIELPIGGPSRTTAPGGAVHG